MTTELLLLMIAGLLYLAAVLIARLPISECSHCAHCTTERRRKKEEAEYRASLSWSQLECPRCEHCAARKKLENK